MWMHIKDDQPIPGSYIKILYKGRILECSCARSSIHVDGNGLTLKHEDFEFWRYKETSAS